MTHLTSSINRLRKALPVLTGLALAMSATLFSLSSAPGSSVFDGPTNLSTFSTSLLFDEPNSVEPRAVSYDPILALDLPYNGEWSAAIQNYNPEPGTVANLLSASATALQQRALINVSDHAAKRSFDTKLTLIAASPDSGATASITDNCLNLQNSKPCD